MIYELDELVVFFRVECNFFPMGTRCQHPVCVKHVCCYVNIWFIELVYGWWHPQLFFFSNFDITDVDIRFVELGYGCRHLELRFFSKFWHYKCRHPFLWIGILMLTSKTMFCWIFLNYWCGVTKMVLMPSFWTRVIYSLMFMLWELLVLRLVDN